MRLSRVAVYAAVVLGFVVLGSVTTPARSGTGRDGLPEIATDRASYGPFDLVTISGSGFEANASLAIQVTDPQGLTRSGDGAGLEGPDVVTTNGDGALTLTYRLAGPLPQGGWYAGQTGAYRISAIDQNNGTVASGTFSVSRNGAAQCGVTAQGAALCLGSNAFGQLGDGTFTNSPDPVAVVGLEGGVARVSASGTHACALLDSGRAVCWGSNAHGQLGNGTFENSSVPVEVINVDDIVVDLVTPDGGTCAVLANGTVMCWGLIGAGPGGTGPFMTSAEPVRTGGPVSGAGESGAPKSASSGFSGAALVTTALGGLYATSRDPDFFWLPPTVPALPAPTGPFDATALNSLAVEVCQLDSAGVCTGSAIELFTASSQPVPTRIKLDAKAEYYTLEWLTGRSHVDRDAFYRVRVLKDGVELGSFDVDLVQNTPDFALVDSARYLGIVRGQQLTIRFRVQRPTARTRVKLNEVESNGGTPGDWAEFYNTANVPLSLGGYVVRDNDDTHSYTLPEGATVPANGYYVVEEASLNFGLGSADAVRLFTPGASVLVDTYSWTAHAATTYGRCPNGTGGFQTTTTVTKGTANDCSIVIRINEIESNQGIPGDWVELYNPGPGPANLTGFVFKGASDSIRYQIPGVVVPAGGYLVIDEANFGFGLGGADAARLFRPDGSLADSYAWSTHATTTYGRCPNGSGAFATTLSATKGAANACFIPVTTLHINEIESSGGVPGDWIELVNTGASPIDLGGWLVRDNDDTHNYLIPTGTMIPAGGIYLVEEAALNFGLGAADSVRLYDPTGALYESYTWTAHAATTYGRCPSGTGNFTTTTSVTKGSANDCGFAVRINEIESSGGVPGDWIELRNNGVSSVNLQGFVLKDNNDANIYTIPANTTIAPGAYLVFDEATFVFGLGSADAVRLYDPSSQLVDSYVWTAHATTTYGRCPDGTGAFTTTTAPTKGAANSCPGVVTAQPWPGDPDFQIVDGSNIFGGNLSGLMYEGSGSVAPGVLWAVRNNPSTLYRLVWNGTIFTQDTANNWSAGKTLLYPNGGGVPDSEGVTFTAAGPGGGVYVSTERDNNVSGTSRNSILRFDVAGSGTSLTATNEWNLTADLPAVGPNLGIEAITWISDSFLTSRGFFDESRNELYDPLDYPNHGTGLFFVGVEATGSIYAYALDHSGSGFTRVATISSSLAGVMELVFDPVLNDLWAVCDDTCNGQSVVLRIDAVTGKFGVARLFDRPSLMPNLNNEGFAITPGTECIGNRRPVFWADDSETGGHSIRRGTMTCSPF